MVGKLEVGRGDNLELMELGEAWDIYAVGLCRKIPAPLSGVPICK